MSYFWKTHKLLRRTISVIIITLHFLTVGMAGEVFAQVLTSASFKLFQGRLSQGGDSRKAGTKKIRTDSVGEVCVGEITSASYVLSSGFSASIKPIPPFQAQTIPNQNWQENESKTNAFDLDDYFISPDRYVLTYAVRGNVRIAVDIDSENKVSFSQAQAWFGTEEIIFTVTDSQGSSIESFPVSLQVSGVNNLPVLEHIEDITVKEGEEVVITPTALDLDGDAIAYSFTAPVDSDGRWQTDYTDAGIYPVTVTATDVTSLSDSQQVKITVINVNRPPILEEIPPITKNETEAVVISPQASDPDGDSINFSYFCDDTNVDIDETGKWVTDYDDAGAYIVTVRAFDGADSVQQQVSVTVGNTNRVPLLELSLSEYTVRPNEEIQITLKARDPDLDIMSFVIKKGSEEIDSGNISNTYSMTTSFSEIGDYTITAIVTDNGAPDNLSAVVTKAVDIVDPNAERDTVNPIMGDFNGDALTDVGLHNSEAGVWEICLSNKNIFASSDEGLLFEAAREWASNFGTTKDWWPIGGDFNGDGKSDIGLYNNITGELKTAHSNGIAFSEQGVQLTVSFASYSWQPFTGNFNADKYTDFALYNKTTGEVHVSLGNSAGFGSFNQWIKTTSTNNIALSGDFNGDSLSDICFFDKDAGLLKVAFSNTESFIDEQTWISGFGAGQDAMLADFNNDGLTDAGYWDKNNYRWNYAVSMGEKFLEQGEWLPAPFGDSSDDSASVGDFNGDGIMDAAVFDRQQIGINRWSIRRTQKEPADLLTGIDNGIGGRTEIKYTYASKDGNSGLPFPVYVTEEVTLTDTAPAGETEESYSQTFAYRGGYYDADEREFRGFEIVQVRDTASGNYTETEFCQGKAGQDGALKGQIKKITAYDNNGYEISQLENTYLVKKEGNAENYLGFPSLEKQTTTVWEETRSFITTETNFKYDNIGNVIETCNEGDMIIDGDEKEAKTAYNPPYKEGFNRPREVVLKTGAGEQVTQKSFTYDTKGNVKKETVWLYNPITTNYKLLTTNYSYDSFGNVTTTINPKGSVVSTQYESDSYCYPEKISNSMGHTILYEYDYRFGKAKKVTDANGAVSETILDSFGRVTREINAYSQVVAEYEYPDFNTKKTIVIASSEEAKQTLITTQHSDGLGRIYKTESSGEDGEDQREVESEVFYNERGQKDYENLAHYKGEEEKNITYIRYKYDQRGRIKETNTDHPGVLEDTASKINYINPLYVETVNPKGQRKGIQKDVYGNIVEIKEFVRQGDGEAKADGAYHTYYEYDAQGNLLKTTDNKGNKTEITYDSLGRKLKMTDPDMGEWFYEYDDAGNLIKQSDAKNQIIEFEYDQINRLTRKIFVGTGLVPVRYEYDDTDKNYCIGRLSKVSYEGGTTEFFYDKLGREIKSIKTLSLRGEAEANSYTVEREYDILDRLTKITYPDKEEVEYFYDQNSGLLEKVSSMDNGLSTIDYVKDITYNARGQIKVIKYGNGTETNYEYGNDLRLSKIQTTNNQLQTTLQELHYNFDKNGNLETLTDNLREYDKTMKFGYDELDRLTSAENIARQGGGYWDLSYRYNSIGNMESKSDVGEMEYSGIGAGPHAVTSAGGYAYLYDANGNMTRGKNKDMAYDAENRLKEVREGSKITEFSYDGDGGRTKKSIVDSPQSIEEKTIYIGSLFEKSIVHRQSSIEEKKTKHIFAGSQRVCSITMDNGQSTMDYAYYHSDHLGSSSVITDGEGKEVARYDYQPYGKTIVDSPKSIEINYLFTGKELDSTGLYYYGARYYDPEIGRFTQADTIVQNPYDPQTLNRYSYCRNNPINYVDPTGHSWKSFWKSFGKGLGSGFVGGLVTALLLPFIGPAAFAVGGAIAGATNAALNGAGWQGILIGAGMGAVLGGALGGLACAGHGLAAGLIGGGLAISGGIHSYQQAGWEAVGDYTGSVIGGIVGFGAGAKVGTGLSRAMAGSSGQQSQITKAKVSLRTDQKPNVGPSQSRLSPNYDAEGRIKSFDLIREGENPFVGQKIYRAFGDSASLDGKSWTPVDPNSVPNYRVQAGLPNANTGRFMAEARITRIDGIVVKEATVIYGPDNAHMITEYEISNVPNQVSIERISGINPEF